MSKTQGATPGPWVDDKPRWNIYRMPQGDWSFGASGRISDGYESERAATGACLDYLSAEVAYFARLADAGEELVREAKAAKQTVQCATAQSEAEHKALKAAEGGLTAVIAAYEEARDD